MKNITSQEILDLISMRQLSFEQMVSELKLKGEELIALSSLLDEMRFSRHHQEKVVLGLTINYNDPAIRRGGACIGTETYLYYRLDEVSTLEKKGLLCFEVLKPKEKDLFPHDSTRVVNLEGERKNWRGVRSKER